MFLKTKDRRKTESSGENMSVFGERPGHITTSTRQRKKGDKEVEGKPCIY